MSDLISTIKATAKRSALPSALALTLLAAPLAATAYAAGDEDETPTCRKGLVWDKKKQIRRVRAQGRPVIAEINSKTRKK